MRDQSVATGLLLGMLFLMLIIIVLGGGVFFWMRQQQVMIARERLEAAHVAAEKAEQAARAAADLNRLQTEVSTNTDVIAREQSVAELKGIIDDLESQLQLERHKRQAAEEALNKALKTTLPSSGETP
ncbi:MAG: hypothetical protein KDB03_15995 [Planctomycetales bacterium]|nr:hypothetical protein [Planctomycetales bacterium]